MSRTALLALWATIVVQSAWIGWAATQTAASHLVYPGIVTFVFLLLALTHGRRPRLAALARAFVGFAFAGSVADRLGVFGAPGAAGVSWGDFAHFVACTRQVNGFLPASFAPGLAVLATLLETVLGVALMLGIGIRVAAAAAAVLLLLFGTAMTISLGFASTFPYAVFVLSAGAWVLSRVDTSRLSVDALWRRRQAART